MELQRPTGPLDVAIEKWILELIKADGATPLNTAAQKWQRGSGAVVAKCWS